MLFLALLLQAGVPYDPMTVWGLQRRSAAIEAAHREQAKRYEERLCNEALQEHMDLTRLLPGPGRASVQQLRDFRRNLKLSIKSLKKAQLYCP